MIVCSSSPRSFCRSRMMSSLAALRIFWSFFTLFALFLLDNFTDTVLPVVSELPFLVFFFVGFLFLTTFGVLNMRQPVVVQIWTGLNRLLEPVYGPIRRTLPNMGGIDLAPLIVILGIFAAEIVLRNNVAVFL